MAMRCTVTGVLTFGLVSIPVKFYLAAKDEKLEFNMLSKAGNRVRQKLVDEVTKDEIEREDTLSGYEVSKGQYVKFTKDELKALELASDDKTVEIAEFVDASAIDLVNIEKSYYLGPDKGGDKGYTLLSQTMEGSNRVAIAQWGSKGRQHLVVIRPYRGGLLLQVLFYANEVRPFEDIEVAKLVVTDQERNLARKLVDSLSSDEFDASKYTDKYRENLQKAVDQKVAGQEVTFAPSAPQIPVVDLFQALQQSLLSAPKPPKAPKVKETPKEAPKLAPKKPRGGTAVHARNK